METDLSFFQTTPFFVSVAVGVAVVIGTSIFFQKQNAEGDEGIQWKPIVRDGILSTIFTTMSWTLFPDFMKKISETVLSFAPSASSAPATSTKVVLNGGGLAPRTTTISTIADDIDIRVGPPNF